MGLQGFEHISSNSLSAGQTRRVNLARLQLLDTLAAPLWLLDEPFTALDTVMVEKLQQRLIEFTQDGGTVLMTSHQPVTVADFVLDLSDYMVM